MPYIKDNNNSEDASNLRQYDRRHSLYYLRIYDPKSDELIGNLVDLSTGGLMMISEQPFKSGESYSFSMQLPSDGENEKRLEFTGIAKWCKQESNPKLYSIGFEIDNPSEAITKTIHELIDAYLFNSY